MNIKFACKNNTVSQFNSIVKRVIKDVGENGLTLFLRVKFRIQSFKDLFYKWFNSKNSSIVNETFVAKEMFVKDSTEVKFRGIWDDFHDWFLTEDHISENISEDQNFCYKNFVNNYIDSSIIAKLGSEAKITTTLFGIYNLLKKQANGEDGVLLTNNYANIFYIWDVNDILRVVIIGWDDEGWCVSAYPVDHFFDRLPGKRVFFPDS